MACCVFQIIRTLIIHLWLSTLITSNPPDPLCIPSIKVPRNTVWKAHLHYPLTINCTVEIDSHCLKKVVVTWCKLDDKNGCQTLNHSYHTITEWNNMTENQRMWFLKFHNISRQDAGLYRCETKSLTPIVGHAINVNVTDHVPDYNSENTDVNQVNITTTTSKPSDEDGEGLLFFICSGIGVVLVVVVVFVIVLRCRGQRRSIKEKIHENQSTESPVVGIVPPMYNRRESPRHKAQTLPAQLSPPPPAIYDTPPARVTSLRDRSSAGGHPVGPEPPRRYHDRGIVEEKEDEDPLIYATLNHAAGPQRPARVAHVQIEASEYAAIKVT